MSSFHFFCIRDAIFRQNVRLKGLDSRFSNKREGSQRKCNVRYIALSIALSMGMLIHLPFFPSPFSRLICLAFSYSLSFLIPLLGNLPAPRTFFQFLGLLIKQEAAPLLAQPRLYTYGVEFFIGSSLLAFCERSSCSASGQLPAWQRRVRRPLRGMPSSERGSAPRLRGNPGTCSSRAPSSRG